jgi:ubiquinone/menaquinone biosynthesis C-methylase UbiE
MGTGQLLFNIAPFFNSSKGLDISDKMLEAAKSQLTSEFFHLKEKVLI